MTSGTSGYLASLEPAMRLALAQAAGGHGETAGTAGSGGQGSGGERDDVPVGAVVLNEAGTVIGAGRNRREADHDPTGHAEIVAMRQAAAALGRWRLDGHMLVVTLEPCTMCAGAAVAARVSQLVYGAYDPAQGAAGSLWDVLRDRRLPHKVEVTGGILADECAQLLRGFFGERRQQPVG